MSRFVRAGGYAAAFAAFAFAAGYSDPSRAWEVDAAPVAVNDLEQAAIDIGLIPGQPSPAIAPTQAIAPAPVAIVPSDEPVAQNVEAAPRSLSDLVGDHSGTATAGAEHDCLAGAVYFEAKGESLRGQLSVAEVVLNRARSGRFPSSICGVVKQRGQFSFIRSGRFPPIARSSAAWRRAVAIARIALDDLADGPAPRAMFFHATYVAPHWRGLTRIATVGNHVFYR